MSDPAYGVPGSPRLPWEQLPAVVRSAVEAHLGSPVVRAVTQPGGFSTGVAARVECGSGRRAFVKAVGTPLNPITPRMHRGEAVVAAALPATAPVPRLRFVHDDGEWVALVFDEVAGVLPELPWSATAADQVMAAIGRLSDALTPCPLPDVVAAADILRPELTAWGRLAADPPADLDPWELRHLDKLVSAGARMAASDGPLDGDTLAHLDLRADNVLLGRDGSVTFVDWAWGCRGPRWLDSAAFALDPFVHGGHDPERLWESAGCSADADPADVTDLLLGLTGMWAESSHAPAPPGMPTIRAHQRMFHDAALAWARRRCNWDEE